MSEPTKLDELRVELGKAKAELAEATTRESLSKAALTEARKEAADASGMHQTDKAVLTRAKEAVLVLVRQVVAAERAKS